MIDLNNLGKLNKPILPTVYEDAYSYLEEVAILRDGVVEVATQSNENKENLNKKVSYGDMKEIYKMDEKADFKGSWFGIEKPTYAEPGIAGVVDKLDKEFNEYKDYANSEMVNARKYGAVEGDETIDNAPFITKAFEENTSVFIDDGTYYFKSGFTIPYNKHLILSPNAILVQLEDVDFIKFRNSSMLTGGTIKVQTPNYTKSALHINGNAKIDNGYVRDCVIISQEPNGTALRNGTGIMLTARGTDTSYVSFFKFYNVKVQYFNIGLLLDSDEHEVSYVNGNLFVDIVLVGCRTCFKTGATDNQPCIVNGNKFVNMQFQDIDSKTETMMLFNGGNQNSFENVHFWDLATGSRAIIMREHSFFNMIEHNLWFNHDTSIIGYWEQNRNIQIINGYYKELMPFDIGTKNIGVKSNPWNSIFGKNVNGLDLVKTLGIFECEAPTSDDGAIYKARISASKWGYLTLILIKDVLGVETIVREIRLSADGLIPVGTVNLGTPDTRFNVINAKVLNLTSANGTKYNITVNNDGTLVTSKVV